MPKREAPSFRRLGFATYLIGCTPSESIPGDHQSARRLAIATRTRRNLYTIHLPFSEDETEGQKNKTTCPSSHRWCWSQDYISGLLKSSCCVSTPSHCLPISDLWLFFSPESLQLDHKLLENRNYVFSRLWLVSQWAPSICCSCISTDIFRALIIFECYILHIYVNIMIYMNLNIYLIKNIYI